MLRSLGMGFAAVVALVTVAVPRTASRAAADPIVAPTGALAPTPEPTATPIQITVTFPPLPTYPPLPQPTAPPVVTPPITIPGNGAGGGAPNIPNGVTALCQAVSWIPSVIPDINGGMAFHFTFTMSQLLTQMQQLCQAQQATQMAAMNFMTLPSMFSNAPAQMSSIFGAGAALPPTMANTGQSQAILGQLQGDASLMNGIENLMAGAQGRDSHQQLTTMLTAANANEMQKLLSLMSSDVATERAQTMQSATNLQQNYLSPTSPDMGDGFMI